MAEPGSIPAFDYQRELAAYRPEIDAALARVLDSGILILGPEVKALEREFGAAVGVAQAIGVASGTDAISLALRAIGVVPGDRIITVANTAVPTVSALRAVGAVPVFVDIDPATLQISVPRLGDLLNSPGSAGVRCILPVNLHGQAADLPAIGKLAAQHNIPVVADCAQAHGTAINGRCVAQFALISCYSFYPTKNLAALGDGGMCVTDSPALAARLCELRQYGFRGDRTAHCEGVCSRLDELQAAVLRVRLKHFEAAQLARQRIAMHYCQGLADSSLTLPQAAPGTAHAWHQFVVRTPQREVICQALQQANIGFGIHYPLPIHLMPAYNFLGYRRGDLPHTEQASEQILSLPMFPTLRADEVQRVIATIRSVAG